MKKTAFYLTIPLLVALTTYSSCKKKKECDDKTSYYQDADGDGYGNTNSSVLDCTQPKGYVTNNTDFDDTNAALNPNSTEIADNYIDENGDGKFDYNLFIDADGDGFGAAPQLIHSPKMIVSIYDIPIGYSFNGNDCNDNNSLINPGASEIANNNIDDNCDGLIDGCSAGCISGQICINGNCETEITYYKDNDGDGYGDLNNSLTAGNTAPSGYVLDNTDCSDQDASICPGCSEVANNGIDDNCNGVIDECGNDADCNDNNPATHDVCINGVCSTIYYLDQDGDGDGDINSGTVILPQNDPIPSGHSLNSLDCNDNDANICSNCIEIPHNGIDDNCNGDTDECQANQTIECDCTDGMDNDGDGDIDCSDSDCIGISGC